MGHVDALSRNHVAQPTEEAADHAYTGVPRCSTPYSVVHRSYRFGELNEMDEDSEENAADCDATDATVCDWEARVNRMAAPVDATDVVFQLRIAQSRDPVVTDLRSRMESEEVQGYSLDDGLVYREGNGETKLLYVPAEMEDNIIRIAHEKIAHMGVDKCCEQMKLHYWFPNMRPKTQKFIENCVKCLMYAAAVRPSEQNLYSIPKTPVLFDTIHLDHFGPLPSLTSKRKHVLVVIDAFTKYVKLYPANSTSTREVTAALEKYFGYYSRPRRVITDRGTAFTSAEFGEFMNERNICHIKVATASAQANGQVERVNRVMKTMLGKLSAPLTHADWSLKLSQIEYAINNSTHSTTKTSPSRLMFGVDQRGETIDALAEYLEAQMDGKNVRELDVN